MCDEESPVIF